MKKITILLLAFVSFSLYAQDACFFEDINMQGRSFCLNVGEKELDLKELIIEGNNFNDTISSVRLAQDVKAEVCRDRYGKGPCTVLIQSDAHMWLAHDNISYIRVYRD